MRHSTCHSLPVVLLAAAALLAACETVVEVELPPHEPQLVAHSFFAPDSLWRVRVSKTVGFTGRQDPAFVDDATVEIWDGDRLVERLARVRDGTYASVTNRPTPGKTYTLRVSAPGFAPTEGRDALPAPGHVTAFAPEIVEDAGDASFGRRIVRVELTVEDPETAKNYYGLQVLHRQRTDDRRTGEVSTTPWSRFGFASNDPALDDPDVFDPEKTRFDEAFFNDDLFDGRAYTLDFELAYAVDRRDPDVTVTRSFAVLLLTVSEDYFRHWKTAELQDQVEENPFAEPVRVHSNLTGGFGIFAGYRAQVFLLEAGDLDG